MSFFLKLDARAKFFFILLLTLLVFIIDKLPSAVCLVSVFLLIRLAAGVPFHPIKFVKSLSLLAVFIILMQTFFGPGEPADFSIPFGYTFKIKLEGFILGIVIVCRIAALYLIFPVFTETTPPYKITSGLCAIGFNYKTAFVITTAFNLIPVFVKEAHVIIDAQRLRGMKRSGIKAFVFLLVPLMLSAMRKAQNSSIAMDSRAFGIYKKRTWTDSPKMKVFDFLFIFACIVFASCMLYINFFLGGFCV